LLAHFGSPATYMPDAYRWRIWLCAGIKKIPLAHLACAPGITCYPSQICNRCARDKILENPKKIKKIPKYFKIVKT
jgi:hypothetical protein